MNAFLLFPLLYNWVDPSLCFERLEIGAFFAAIGIRQGHGKRWLSSNSKGSKSNWEGGRLQAMYTMHLSVVQKDDTHIKKLYIRKWNESRLH